MISFERRRRLYGKAIFLSASVPDAKRPVEFQRVPDAATNIEAAVVALARSVFIESGTLVFGGHPSISPLIARVVQDYISPKRAESDKEVDSLPNPSVVIFQSRAFEGFLPDATQGLSGRIDCVATHWTEAVGGEMFDPQARGTPQVHQSLRAMRQKMIDRSDLVAMVVIGGMEGVIEEVDIFAKYHTRKPIFALETTGGAAGLIAEGRRLSDSNTIEVPDRGWKQRVVEFWKENGGSPFLLERTAGGIEGFYTPYGLIASKIVDQVIEIGGRRDR